MNTLALTTGKRKIKDGSRYNHLFPAKGQSYGNSTILNEDGSVEQTVKYMAGIIKRDAADTAKIAQVLKGKTREETLRNIHGFMIDYLQYDTEDQEQLRSPRRTWWVGQSQRDEETGDQGVDCDDLAIFSGSILYNLGIPFFIRIVKISGDEWQHVYLVVPASGRSLSAAYITLDGVISQYNYEYPYHSQNTFDMHGNKLKISYLGSVDPIDPTDSLKAWIEQYLKGISSGEMQTRHIHRDDVVNLLSYILDNWEDEHDRITAIEHASDMEQRYYPMQRVFRTIRYVVENGAWPKAQELKGLGDPNNPYDPDYNPSYASDPGFWDNPQSWSAENSPNAGAYDGPTNGGSSSNSSNTWANILAGLNILANFDWGVFSGGGNKNTPVVTPTPTTNAGYSFLGASPGTWAVLALIGGLSYMAFVNIRANKTGSHPMIEQSTRSRKKTTR